MPIKNNHQTNVLSPGTDASTDVSAEKMDALIREFDDSGHFRDLGGFLKIFVTTVCVALSLFHVYTAGFGVLNEISHRTVHMAFIMGVLFLVIPRRQSKSSLTGMTLGVAYGAFYVVMATQLVNAFSGQLSPVWTYGVYGLTGLLALSALPLKILGGYGNRLGHIDGILAVLGAGFSGYLVYFFEDIFIANIGFPQPLDYLMGGVAIILVIEGARRTLGESLSVIAVLALLYAMSGPLLPGVLAHRGYDITRLIEHLYLGTEGLYGIATGVVATYVFHFVLFGVLAQMSGLGTLFIEFATWVAGRYVGGPAKVSVVSSGFLGMISGSSVANTVTTGALTIPMMKRYGFSGRFSAATEAAASCGGQITPPIMGAAAFVMSEMLGVPYNELILIAILPAAFHYLATLCTVHFEAKRLGLTGMPAADIPRLGDIMARHWHQTIPLIVMVSLLLTDFTPFMAAFWGIILTVVCSYLPLILQNVVGCHRLDRNSVLTPRRLIDGLEKGAMQSIAITAACACVGFLLGVTTLTGLGFKFSGAVVELAHTVSAWVTTFVPFDLVDEGSIALFVALLLVAVACILTGAGVPTTPTYIILAAIVAPALNEFGVALLAAHFFIFYYGVLADVTPPVALAAYASAGIAGSDPMKTGVAAFRLSMGKALVPFMIIYAPSLLFLDFNWVEFSLAVSSGVLCIIALSAAYVGYFNRPLRTYEKVILTVSGLMLVGDHPGIIAIFASTVLFVLFGPDRLAPRIFRLGASRAP